MKNAFALRMSLGDPGPDPSNPFVNTTKQDALLHDTLSRKFADSLRYARSKCCGVQCAHCHFHVRRCQCGDTRVGRDGLA